MKQMNTLDLLENRIELLKSLGYEIHYDWFGGTGGGACQIGNRRCLFLDLALGPLDHLRTANELLETLQQHQLPRAKAA